MERGRKFLEEQLSKAKQKKTQPPTLVVQIQLLNITSTKTTSEAEPIDPKSVIDAVRESVCLCNVDLSSNKDFDTRNKAWVAICGRLEVRITTILDLYLFIIWTGFIISTCKVLFRIDQMTFSIV